MVFNNWINNSTVKMLGLSLSSNVYTIAPLDKSKGEKITITTILQCGELKTILQSGEESFPETHFAFIFTLSYLIIRELFCFRTPIFVQEECSHELGPGQRHPSECRQTNKLVELEEIWSRQYIIHKVIERKYAIENFNILFEIMYNA